MLAVSSAPSGPRVTGARVLLPTSQHPDFRRSVVELRSFMQCVCARVGACNVRVCARVCACARVLEKLQKAGPGSPPLRNFVGTLSSRGSARALRGSRSRLTSV